MASSFSDAQSVGRTISGMVAPKRLPPMIPTIGQDGPPPDKLVGALTSGINVLRYLAGTAARVGVTRIAKDLGLNSSTCFNIMRTLVHERLVYFDNETKTYSLALGLVELAKGALEQSSYARMIHPDLETIARTHDVTVTLWHCTTGDRVVLVDRMESNTAVRVHMSIGQRLPMFIGALGRAMAANLDLDRPALRRQFTSLRWSDPPSFDEYAQEVEKARKLGYAVDADRYAQGVTTISSAVLAQPAQPVMAISAIGFSAQLKPSKVRAIGEDLRDCAVIASRALMGGARPVPEEPAAPAVRRSRVRSVA